MATTKVYRATADDPPQVTDEDKQVVDLDEAYEAKSYRYGVTSYGADFPADSLIKRMANKDIVIPTFDPPFPPEDFALTQGFQRNFVWTKLQMDRFIESLLLGLPIPGIFLVIEPNNKFLVLDGQQRLRTLQAYEEGIVHGKEFALGSDVVDPFKGKRFKDLSESDQRQINNTLFHATIVRQEQPSNDQSSIYLIFERLNTGGTRLEAQEIRVALYRGPFVNLLRSLNRTEDWRKIFGPVHKRMKDQELILRFFALKLREYKSPMTEFLNGLAGDNRDLAQHSEQELTSLFLATTKAVRKILGEHTFRVSGNTLNAAVCDSVMVAIARRLEDGEITEPDTIRANYKALLGNPDYSLAVSQGTSHEDNVKTRLALATEAFASVP